jgi:hypothetical protein
MLPNPILAEEWSQCSACAVLSEHVIRVQMQKHKSSKDPQSWLEDSLDRFALINNKPSISRRASFRSPSARTASAAFAADADADALYGDPLCFDALIRDTLNAHSSVTCGRL